MTEYINIAVQTETLVRVLLLGFLGFASSMIITPIYTTLAYRYEWWKKPRQKTLTGETASVFQQLHGAKHKRLIPTMAGVIFVAAVTLVTVFLNFERTETWLPLAADRKSVV